MNGPDSVTRARQSLLQRLFPDQVPRLWCPLLTHYDDTGRIDGVRMAAHLRHLSPFVKGFLIPGSTGDGWEMSDPEIHHLLELALEQAAQLNFHLLIGVLKTNADEARHRILETASWLRSRTGASDNGTALAKSRVAGFTVCPPRGKDLTQQQIGAALESILETGMPVSLYQLPQVTENTLSAELVAKLAERFPHFHLFKDTSGADAVALAGQDPRGVFMVRGAEGDYLRWLKKAGGPYDGFLLSTANCFARELHRIVSATGSDRAGEMAELSQRLTAAVREAFAAVRDVPKGNPFANANKAMDHCFAHGPGAATVIPPRLHAGIRLPLEVVRDIGQILVRYDLMPDRGYLERV